MSAAASEDRPHDDAALARLEALGGPDFVLEMIETFRTHGETLLEQMRAALAQADARALERGAHSLKSSAANLGAQRLRSLAWEAEQRARAGAIDDFAQRLAALEDAFGTACAWLDERRAGFGS